jgi:hypothetical protein
MASDLREKLETYVSLDGNVLPLVPSHRRARIEGARLALESLPCECEIVEHLGYPHRRTCDRCTLLASLASEGKGG